MSDFDCIVAGAGVVGLAVARELALAGRSVLIVEAQAQIGTGISARNSEVIHAGLYYEPGSLKAALCVEGRRRLYDYCAERGVPHRRLGKLIVAVEPAQVEKLEAIRANGIGCGVEDLSMLTRAQASALEPALTCAAALWSPVTGIVDGHALMNALLADAEAAGATIIRETSVDHVTPRRGALDVLTRHRSGEPFAVTADCLVNAAGLDAPELASRIGGLPRDRIPRQWLARGVYFSLVGPSPFSRLIYPLPVDGGLGVHLTLDMGGMARFGPDVEWIDRVDYTVDPSRAGMFAEQIRHYWPGFDAAALQPAYSGIRPKLSGPGAPAADFMIQGPAEHGAGPIVNLFGIESPGLTASLAIAARVAAMLPA